MVNNCSRYKPSVRFALHAQWILPKIRFAYPLPLTAVATLCSGGTFGMEGLVLVTVAVVS